MVVAPASQHTQKVMNLPQFPQPQHGNTWADHLLDGLITSWIGCRDQKRIGMGELCEQGRILQITSACLTSLWALRSRVLDRGQIVTRPGDSGVTGGGSQLEPHFGDHLFLTPWEGRGAALLHSYLVDVGEKGLVWVKGKNRTETGDLQEIKRKKRHI